MIEGLRVFYLELIVCSPLDAMNSINVNFMQCDSHMFVCFLGDEVMPFFSLHDFKSS